MVFSTIALDFGILETFDPIDITDSEHKITIMHWKINIEFAQYIKAEGKKLEDKIATIEGTLQLNKAWDTWLRIVKTAANKFIPFLYVVPKQFFAQTMKTTKLYRALTTFNKVIYRIKIMVPPLNPEYKLAEINKKILKLTKQTEIGLSLLAVKDLTVNKKMTIEKLKEAKTQLWAAQNAENQAVQNERISFYVNRRCKDMKENTIRIINSILA
ncbi:6031_t:CDS:2 [Gigaspora margarita]|uniref:6031_t:CDS:1 n=1 Tax=Gigaspora margarita TaxID=4874 RepID=A0ABN7W8J7_GIGMA|nr:6031_t:CDS:2 [Gigaspora margarita]